MNSPLLRSRDHEIILQNQTAVFKCTNLSFLLSLLEMFFVNNVSSNVLENKLKFLQCSFASEMTKRLR